MARLNRVNIHEINSTHMGVYREPFDRVVEITGFRLRPVEGSNCVWDFDHPESQEKGRLLHVEGFLNPGAVALNHRGHAYLITRQGYTLALLFPSSPHTMALNEVRHKILPKTNSKVYPANWPPELVSQIIRARFRTVVIADETFLLKKIGLREPSVSL